GVLEHLGAALQRPQADHLLEDDGPRPEGRQQEGDHDRFHNPVGLHEQAIDRHVDWGTAAAKGGAGDLRYRVHWYSPSVAERYIRIWRERGDADGATVCSACRISIGRRAGRPLGAMQAMTRSARTSNSAPCRASCTMSSDAPRSSPQDVMISIASSSRAGFR